LARGVVTTSVAAFLTLNKEQEELFTMSSIY